MNSTFLELVNRVCERLNETPIEESQFQNVKNIHASIKNCVQDAIYMILQEEKTWPFLAIEQTVVLDPGTGEYAWPTDFDSVDWNSFFVRNDNGDWRPLRLLQKETWYERQRSLDAQTIPKGRDCPITVFSTHGFGFGISPVPDKAYHLKYRYWRTTHRIEKATDECRIPSQYEYVIVAAALSLMYSFLDNTERASFWDGKYKEGLRAMKRTLLSNNFHHAVDGRVPNRMVSNSITYW